MDEFLIKFCVRCKEIKRVKKSDLAKKSCCNKCGSKYVVPEEVNDKVRLEMATRLLASVIINGERDVVLSFGNRLPIGIKQHTLIIDDPRNLTH